MRKSTDPLAYFRLLEEKPYHFDFFQALRHIESLYPDKPRLGCALRPVDEPVRLGQEVSLAFAPTTLSAFTLPSNNNPARMQVRFFGMLGVNGPLPLHLTEYAQERLLHQGDATFVNFLDLFHHRFLLLFYRAWAQAQPAVSLDRPTEDRFSSYVGSLCGLGDVSQRNRDEVPDFAKLFYSGYLARQVRSREGLAALLTGFFRLPISVEEFVGHRMVLQESERTVLGKRNGGAVLGGGTVLGGSIWDRQHKFRLHIGPLTLNQYESFLPGGSAIAKLVAWVRQYLCFELEWDAKLSLLKAQVPKVALGIGKSGRLGWTTWLGHYQKNYHASNLILDAEKCMKKHKKLAADNQTNVNSVITARYD